MKLMMDIIRQHKEMKPVGICSVCSAHPLVIKAALLHAKKNHSLVLIEATSNQVNQFGGYTGMKPVDFRDMVYSLAASVGLPVESILLGGDHLGPNCWQGEAPEKAMDKSKALIEAYIEAGFRKIHLDCSMSCLGDSVPLDDETVANRAAILCEVAEQTWLRVGGEAPVYIVGTEVPVPGGATEELDTLEVTSPNAAVQTLVAHEQAFLSRGLENAWERVIGLVVQPGVEFDHHKVIDYVRADAQALSKAIMPYTNRVFEAHSTDYQRASNLKELVEDHFAILKVGPAVTFAMREAIWGLDQIEQEWLGAEKASNIRKTMVDVMRDKPQYWNAYYQGDDQRVALDMEFSLSDRIRYYWADERVTTAMDTLIANFKGGDAPITLLSQYLPEQYVALREEQIAYDVEPIIINKIQGVLNQYAVACGQ